MTVAGFDLSGSGAVEEEACGGGAGFFEAEVLVLSQFDRAQGRAGEEFVEDLYGKVVAKHAGFDASFQRGSDRRLELVFVSFLDSGQVADEHRVPVADGYERAQDSLDRVLDCCALEASGGETAGRVVERVED